MKKIISSVLEDKELELTLAPIQTLDEIRAQYLDNKLSLLEVIESLISQDQSSLYDILVEKRNDSELSWAEMVIKDIALNFVYYSKQAQEVLKSLERLFEKLNEEERVDILMQSPETIKLMVFWTKPLAEKTCDSLSKEDLLRCFLSPISLGCWQVMSNSIKQINFEILKKKIEPNMLFEYLQENISIETGLDNDDKTDSGLKIISRFNGWVQKGGFSFLMFLPEVLSEKLIKKLLKSMPKESRLNERYGAKQIFVEIMNLKKEELLTNKYIIKTLLLILESRTNRLYGSIETDSDKLEMLTNEVFDLLNIYFHPTFLKRRISERNFISGDEFLMVYPKNKGRKEEINLEREKEVESVSKLKFSGSEEEVGSVSKLHSLSGRKIRGYIEFFTDYLWMILDHTDVSLIEGKSKIDTVKLLIWCMTQTPDFGEPVIKKTNYKYSKTIKESFLIENKTLSIYQTVCFRVLVVDIESSTMFGKNKVWIKFKKGLKKCQDFKEVLSRECYEEEKRKYIPFDIESEGYFSKMEEINFNSLDQTQIARLYLLLQNIDEKKSQIEASIDLKSSKSLSVSVKKTSVRVEATSKTEIEETIAVREARQKEDAERKLAREAAQKEREKAERVAAESERVLKKDLKEAEKKRACLESLKPMIETRQAVSQLRNEVIARDRNNIVLKEFDTKVEELWVLEDQKALAILVPKFGITEYWKTRFSAEIGKLNRIRKPTERVVGDRSGKTTVTRVSVSEAPAEHLRPIEEKVPTDSSRVRAELSVSEYREQETVLGLLIKLQEKAKAAESSRAERVAIDPVGVGFEVIYLVIKYLNICQALCHVIRGNQEASEAITRFRAYLVHESHQFFENNQFKDQVECARASLEILRQLSLIPRDQLRALEIKECLERQHLRYSEGLSKEKEKKQREVYLKRVCEFILDVEDSKEKPSKSLVFAVGSFIECVRKTKAEEIREIKIKNGVKLFKQELKGASLDRNAIFHLDRVDPKMIRGYVEWVKRCFNE